MKAILLFLLCSSVFSMDLKEWDKFSEGEKVKYMDHTFPSLELASNETQRLPIEVKEILLNAPLTEVYLNDDYDMYGVIGDVKRYLEIFTTKENELLGYREVYIQQGCSHLDDSGEWIDKSAYYLNEVNANKNNCFDNDVSWSGYSYRDERGIEIDHSQYLEWSGH